MSEEALEDTHKPENVLARSSLSKYFTKPNVPETFSQTGYGLGWRTGHYRGMILYINNKQHDLSETASILPCPHHC
jgi:hypothetical protein